MRAFVMTRSWASRGRTTKLDARTARPIKRSFFIGGILRQPTAEDAENAEEALHHQIEARAGSHSDSLGLTSRRISCISSASSASSAVESFSPGPPCPLWWSFCASVLDSPRTESLHGGTDESSPAS